MNSKKLQEKRTSCRINLVIMTKTNKTDYGKETKRIIKVGTNVGGLLQNLQLRTC